MLMRWKSILDGKEIKKRQERDRKVSGEYNGTNHSPS